MNKNSINFLWASSRRLLEELSIVHSMLLDTNTRRSFGTRCLQGLLPTRSVRTMDIPHICRWSNMEFFMEKAKQQQEYTLVCSCDEWFVSLAAGRRQGNTSFSPWFPGFGASGSCVAAVALRTERGEHPRQIHFFPRAKEHFRESQAPGQTFSRG